MAAARIGVAANPPEAPLDATPPTLPRIAFVALAVIRQSTRSGQVRRLQHHPDRGVEMRQMVRRANLHVHPDNDPEKAAKLRHSIILPRIDTAMDWPQNINRSL